MKYFSTFSGIGGFELGIKQSYEFYNLRPDELADSKRPKELHNSSDKLQQWECIGYSETDKYAIQIYEKHFQHKNYGDITKINAKELPDFDLLCGGFPCQAFSIAGKRKGFEDTRGTLIYDVFRILREKQPSLVLLENVKGLLSHQEGRTFSTIISSLDELGYDLQWQVLNSKNFGVPQNRERVFIIGNLRGTPRPKVFPIRENSKPDIVLPTLTARYWGGQANGSYIGNKPKQIIGGSQGNRVYDPSGTSTTLASQAGGLGAKTGLYAVLTPDRANKRQNGIKIRRLTPLECERLQGFPAGWTEGISDTQRYKTLGNAVTVNVIKEIFKSILIEEE